MNSLKYKIKFLSDWAILSGNNTAGIDNRLLCDNKGFPYIPGKSIKGVFREAFEEIIDILELSDDDKKQALRMFGKTKEDKKNNFKENGTLIFSNGEIDEKLKKEIFKLNEEERKFVLNEMSIVVPRTTIDEDTNMSKEGALAFIEFGRKGMEFNFTISKENDWTAQEKDIIDYCRKYVKRLGAMRSRGKGKCKITLEEK